MAANFRAAKGVAAVGRRIFDAAQPSLPAPPAFGRKVHTCSVYDKNIEEHVRPAVVPDYVIQQHSDKYWAPNPLTGVFGPDTNPVGGGWDRGFHTSSSASGGDSESVLDQKAFFRPLEDLEKPQYHHC